MFLNIYFTKIYKLSAQCGWMNSRLETLLTFFFTPTFEHVVLETPEIVVSQPELGYHGEVRECADLYLGDEVAMETDEGQGRHAPEVGVTDDHQVVVVEVDSDGASRDVGRDLKYYKREGE